jgi:predicted TIM-barrel fold metal-dependent hydrolase
MHKPNIWIDLSGWSPKYFAPQLVQYANTLLRDRILFGSDFPLITPERWLKDFESAGFKDEVKPLILKTNAMRLLGLAPRSSLSRRHLQAQRRLRGPPRQRLTALGTESRQPP